MKISNKQKAENAVKWINRLSTTSVKQSKGKLGNSETGYCCLGYGCKVLDLKYNWDGGASEDLQNITGMKTHWGNFTSIVEENGSEYKSLDELNDLGNLSFRRISTVMKNRIDEIFLPEVAKLIKEKLGR